jgi:hypothetical protein
MTESRAERELEALERRVADAASDVTFGDIVQARVISRRNALRRPGADIEMKLRDRFRQLQGPTQHEYICVVAVGGCAVTAPPPNRTSYALLLHTVLNSQDARLIGIETRCNEIADQVVGTLPARPSFARHMRGAVSAVFSVMTYALAAADEMAKGVASERIETDVAAAEDQLRSAQRRTEILLQQWARGIYLQGVLIGTLLTGVLIGALGVANAHLWADVIHTAPLMLATTFGALGAVVSVLQRISAGRLVLDITAETQVLRRIALLRPFVGAVFGAVAEFALAGGLLGTANAGSDSFIGLFAVVGFAAGFSERFATDMVERAGRLLLGDPTSGGGPSSAPAGGLTAPMPEPISRSPATQPSDNPEGSLAPGGSSPAAASNPPPSAPESNGQDPGWQRPAHG